MFKKGELDYLVTTSILERGITVKNLQVIIFNADNKIYTRYALEQIAGRVGRKKDAPDGDCWYLVSKETKEVRSARESIIEKNKYL